MRDLNDVWDKPVKEPESPCVKVCFIDSQTGFCIGCSRSLREITEWETATSTEKELILENIKKRKENENSSVK